MKLTFLAILTIWSMSSFGQCVDCTSFEEALKEPKKVNTLKINPWQHKVTLDSIPASIGLFVNAEIIWLSGHNINSIPKSIGNLKKLKELSFAECKLTKLPDEVFLLKNLKEVVLFYNDFTEEYILELKARFKKELPKVYLLID